MDQDDESLLLEAIGKPLEPEVFEAFLRERGGALTCRDCGMGELKIQLDVDNRYVFAGSFPDLGVTSFMPVVHTSCQHCGLIRSYDREVIARWIGDL